MPPVFEENTLDVVKSAMTDALKVAGLMFRAGFGTVGRRD